MKREEILSRTFMWSKTSITLMAVSMRKLRDLKTAGKESNLEVIVIIFKFGGENN